MENTTFNEWIGKMVESGEVEVITLDPGNKVYCDFCGKDYTDSSMTGGFLFQGKAVCPVCQPDMERRIAGYHEQHFIRGWCPEGMAFADWIRGMR